jgi:hypothetical protein
MRKLAREAVIFMLLGPVVAGLVSLVYLNRQSAEEIKAQAAKAVYAVEAPPVPLPPGFTPENAVEVPLSNGTQLNVTDCNRLHPWVVASETLAPKLTSKEPDQKATAPGEFREANFQDCAGRDRQRLRLLRRRQI